MVTIYVSFDQTILPEWAQKFPNVVSLCERDLVYRCRVFEAETWQLRRILIREAEERSNL